MWTISLLGVEAKNGVYMNGRCVGWDGGAGGGVCTCCGFGEVTLY